MKVFELTLETYPLDNTDMQVVLKPTDPEVSKYIADYVVMEQTTSVETLNNHKITMRDVLFNKFQELEGVDQTLKEEFIL